MNKQLRKLKGLSKQKRRIKIWTLNGAIKPSKGIIHDLKTMSTPCSCTVCSPRKVDKFKLQLKLRTTQELKEARVAAYEYLIL